MSPDTPRGSPHLTGRIVSVQVGTPQRRTTPAGRVWESAIGKDPVAGPVALHRTQLAGDQQADTRHHGGPDKAVCCYSAEHYPEWRETLGLDLLWGAFGENLTLENLTEEIVCIGDIFTMNGGVVVQVTQPRQPCINIARRWNRADLPQRMEANGRTGCYLRVLEEGALAAGDTLTLRARPHPGWTILSVNTLVYGPSPDREALRALSELDALSVAWKQSLRRRLARKAKA